MRKPKCRYCLQEFIKTNPLNPYCKPICERKAKSERKKIAEEKVKKRKEKLKEKKKNSKKFLITKADTLFSRFVRFRDCMKTTGNLES